MNLLPKNILADKPTITPHLSECIYQNKILTICPSSLRHANPRVTDFGFNHTSKPPLLVKVADSKDANSASTDGKQKYLKRKQLGRSQVVNRFKSVNTKFDNKLYSSGKKDRFYSNSFRPNLNHGFRYPHSRMGLVMSEFSIQLPPKYELLYDLNSQKLCSLSLPSNKVEISTIGWKGQAYAFKPDFELIQPTNPLILPESFNKILLSDHPKCLDDETLCNSAENPEVDAVITSNVLALLMCVNLSRYGWQVVCYKFGKTLVFDVPEENNFVDLNIVGEHSDLPADVSQKEIAKKAAVINCNFQNFCLDKENIVVAGDDIEFENVHPIYNSQLYHYRQLVIPPINSVSSQYGSAVSMRPLTVHVRGFIHAASTDTNGNISEYHNIHCFNEGLIPSKKSTWKQSLQKEKGFVIVRELRENSNVFGRWLFNCIVSGASTMKLGFVSTNNNEHSLLNIHSAKINELMVQYDFKLNNSYAIFREICDIILNDTEHTECKYYITKESFNPNLRIHRAPIDLSASDEN